jgi:hypothetical protein
VDLKISWEFDVQWRLNDELGKNFQGCFLPNIPLELILNRHSESLHKSLKLNKFEFLRRTTENPSKYSSTEEEMIWPIEKED